MRFFCLLLALLLISPAVLACDLEPWPGKGQPTAKKVIDRLVADKSADFLGMVLVKKVTDEGDNIRYDLITMRQYIGENTLSLSMVSPKSNSCVLKVKEDDGFLLKRKANDEQIFLYDTYFYHVPEKDLITYLDQKYPAEAVD